MNTPDTTTPDSTAQRTTSDAVGPSSWYADEGVWVGGNMPEGIFCFSGPSFRSEGLGRRANIVDLAPTLLHSMGGRVPKDVDGDVLDVFAPEARPAMRAVRFRDPLPVDESGEVSGGDGVEERLADLGYLE